MTETVSSTVGCCIKSYNSVTETTTWGSLYTKQEPVGTTAIIILPNEDSFDYCPLSKMTASLKGFWKHSLQCLRYMSILSFMILKTFFKMFTIYVHTFFLSCLPSSTYTDTSNDLWTTESQVRGVRFAICSSLLIFCLICKILLFLDFPTVPREHVAWPTSRALAIQPALAMSARSWFMVKPADRRGLRERDLDLDLSSVLVIMSTLSRPAIPATSQPGHQRRRCTHAVGYLTDHDRMKTYEKLKRTLFIMTKHK